MNLIINTVGGQFLTLTPEMLQEKLGLKSDILSLGIEVSDDNTAITAQSYTKWECAGDTICPLIDVNVKNDGKEMQAAMRKTGSRPQASRPVLTMMTASILCLWTTVSESLFWHLMSSKTVTESFLPGARPARNCLTSMSMSHRIAEFTFATANLCMTGSCLRAAPFFVPFSLHILANRIDWYLGRCFHP